MIARHLCYWCGRTIDRIAGERRSPVPLLCTCALAKTWLASHDAVTAVVFQRLVSA